MHQPSSFYQSPLESRRHLARRAQQDTCRVNQSHPCASTCPFPRRPRHASIEDFYMPAPRESKEMPRSINPIEREAWRRAGVPDGHGLYKQSTPSASSGRSTSVMTPCLQTADGSVATLNSRHNQAARRGTTTHNIVDGNSRQRHPFFSQCPRHPTTACAPSTSSSSAARIRMAATKMPPLHQGATPNGAAATRRKSSCWQPLSQPNPSASQTSGPEQTHSSWSRSKPRAAMSKWMQE